MRVQTPLGADFIAQYDPGQSRSWCGVISEKALKEGKLILQLPAGEFGMVFNKKPLVINGEIYFDVSSILYDRVISGVEVMVENRYLIDYNAKKDRGVLDKYFKRYPKNM